MMKAVVTVGKPYFTIAREEAGYFLKQGCRVVRDAGGDTIKVMLAVGQRVCCGAGHQIMVAPGLMAAAVTLLGFYRGLVKWEIEVI
jgi:hypothetical protein